MKKLTSKEWMKIQFYPDVEKKLRELRIISKVRHNLILAANSPELRNPFHTKKMSCEEFILYIKKLSKAYEVCDAFIWMYSNEGEHYWLEIDNLLYK